MKSEKTTLILIFTLFFVLSSTLMYLMIEKDLRQKNVEVKKMSEPVTNGAPENVWPKVEINTSK